MKVKAGHIMKSRRKGLQEETEEEEEEEVEEQEEKKPEMEEEGKEMRYIVSLHNPVYV